MKLTSFIIAAYQRSIAAWRSGGPSMKLTNLETIARALNSSGVPFLVVGGVAVVAHGYGRQTPDLDLVIPLDAPSVTAAFAVLARLGYRNDPPATKVSRTRELAEWNWPSIDEFCSHRPIPLTADQLADPQTRARWIGAQRAAVLAFHSKRFPETPIDIFATEHFDFAAEHHAAKVVEIAPGVPLRILRLEALLRMKAGAGRPQDLADIAELRQLHGDVP